MVGSVWIISNNPKLVSWLLEHLKIFIGFKCSNSNRIWVNSEIQNVLEIYSSFLAEVFTFIRNHEHFQWAFWVLWKIFWIEPSWVPFGARVWTSPFQYSNKFRHDAWKLMQIQTRPELGLWQFRSFLLLVTLMFLYFQITKNPYLSSILHLYHHLFTELVHLYNLPLYWVCWEHKRLFVI